MGKRNLVSYFFSVVLLLTSFTFYFLWRPNLELTTNFSRFFSGALALIVCTSVINILFLTSRAPLALLVTLLSSLIAVYVYRDLLPYSLIAGAISFILLISAYFDLSKALTLFKRLDVNHLWPTRTIISALMLALSILVVGRYSQPGRDLTIKIPDEVFNSAAKFSTELVGGNGKAQPSSLPSTLLEETFEKEIPRLRKELSKAGVVDEALISDKIEAAREAFLSQVESTFDNKQFNNLLSDQLKTVKTSLEKQLNDLLDPYRTFFPYVMGILFYLTISLFSPFLGALSNLFSFVIFRTLLLLKVVSIRVRSEPVEFLEI